MIIDQSGSAIRIWNCIFIENIINKKKLLNFHRSFCFICVLIYVFLKYCLTFFHPITGLLVVGSCVCLVSKEFLFFFKQKHSNLIFGGIQFVYSFFSFIKISSKKTMDIGKFME